MANGIAYPEGYIEAIARAIGRRALGDWLRFALETIVTIYSRPI